MISNRRYAHGDRQLTRTAYHTYAHGVRGLGFAFWPAGKFMASSCVAGLSTSRRCEENSYHTQIFREKTAVRRGKAYAGTAFSEP